MHYSWQRSSTFIVLVIIISRSNVQMKATNGRKPDENTDDLPPDFVNFVKSLDTMVYKREHTTSGTETTKPDPKAMHKRFGFNKNTNIQSTQNAALRDILMLKLVSYYEDKYKLTNEETTKRPMDVISRQTFTPTTQHTIHYPEAADSIENIALIRKNLNGMNTDNIKLLENTQDNTLDRASQDLQDSKFTLAEVVAL